MPDADANQAAATLNETVSVLDMAENADDYALIVGRLELDQTWEAHGAC